MSIISSIYADYANQVKKEWEDELADALSNKDAEASCLAVRRLLKKMRKFYFSE